MQKSELPTALLDEIAAALADHHGVPLDFDTGEAGDSWLIHALYDNAPALLAAARERLILRKSMLEMIAAINIRESDETVEDYQRRLQYILKIQIDQVKE